MTSSDPDSGTVPTLSSGAAAVVVATKNPTKAVAADSSPFLVGEKVLGFHGSCLYDAKILQVEMHKDGWRHFVHYLGWNKKWDEWLGIDRLLKPTDENVQRQKELKQKLALEKNPKLGNPLRDSSTGVRVKKRKHESIYEDDRVVPLEKVVNIQIPLLLKKQLVDANECITQLNQLVKLPRSPSVHEILNKYYDCQVKKDHKTADTIAEVVKGLCHYFDKALPTVLLYKNERQQYKEVIVDNIPPSSVYGAEHLLRLFVKLPEMLTDLHIQMDTLTQLRQISQDLLRFLQMNRTTFFLSSYQTSVEDEDN
ncbi:mortality factor 4-like protein 1 [Dorcoceras hygrometricum]|uniref:Mortality factor 4-like protein 1 n=1 Tax=Dorcoceras hygrometricum TaxID=472368 RepID=A0A2Z7DBX3_9LAMI|nr:mortality factor 4-like protein 1 [Dorcoceras hygrometricum]